MSKSAIVVGASSGIGRALVVKLASEGYRVVALARREELLKELQDRFPESVRGVRGDISEPGSIRSLIDAEIQRVGMIDLFVNCAGVGFPNRNLEWEPEQTTIRVNVEGFAAVAGLAMAKLIDQGSGTFVNLSSIAALRGSSVAPAYNASKAFESNYLEGLRVKVRKLGLPISVIDIQPGFVATAMAKGDRMFWVASPEKAAEQIFHAIRRRKGQAYVTRRWRLIALVFKICPQWLYWRIS